MIAAGIDPGTANLGLVVVEVAPDGERLLESWTFKTRSGWPIEARVAYLYTRVEEVLERHRPEVVGIENWVYHPKDEKEDGEEKKKKSRRGTTWESQAVQRVIGGLYILQCRGFKLRVLEPAHWKRQFTGLANCHRADKKEIDHAVEWAVRLRLGVNAGHDFDEHRYDAAGIALTVAGMQRIAVTAGVNIKKIGRAGWK